VGFQHDEDLTETKHCSRVEPLTNLESTSNSQSKTVWLKV